MSTSQRSVRITRKATEAVDICSFELADPEGRALPPDDDGALEVQVASSGAVIRAAPDQSVVAALAAAGIEVAVSSEQGVCGTCLTRVLEGTPDHRDMHLTPDEQAKCDQFTPCCSRAKTPRLVLDL
jgi:vanillate O-demethylase ferredoxin subunit